MKFTISYLTIMVLLVSGVVAYAQTPAADDMRPWAELRITRHEDTGDLSLSLAVRSVDMQDHVIEYTVSGGIGMLEDFGKWYEEVFAVAYLDGNTKSMWKRLRKRADKIGPEFLSEEILDALRECKLMVVVDETYPFIADVIRFDNKWLFEIVPIVHATADFDGEFPDLSDDYKYKSVLVDDCQGPDDREGAEAPGVAARLEEIPELEHRLATTLTNEEAARELQAGTEDILHLATHAHPEEFFPGRGETGIKVDAIKAMTLPYRFILSTGCHTGNPLFAGAVLDDDTRFYMASMYVTSGKDGIVIAGDIYKAIAAGKTPFEAFMEAKQNITGKQGHYPDILRYVFYVK